jgi:hypothetical protein
VCTVTNRLQLLLSQVIMSPELTVPVLFPFNECGHPSSEEEAADFQIAGSTESEPG